jgi:replication factor A1
MNLNNAEEIYNIIKSQTNKSDTELKEELKKVQDKYQGLLSEVGANIMLAKQLNVDLELKRNVSEVLKISELNSSLNSVSIYARIKNIPPLKTYKGKDGNTGKLQIIYLQDNTGIIKLNLWQEISEIVSELNLQKNDLVFIKDAFISEFNEKLDLSLRHGGQLIKEPENAPDIKKIEDNYIDISKIDKAEEKPITTIGRIINLYPPKVFEDSKTKKARKVINMNISDGIKEIRCTVWSPWAEVIEDNYNLGDLIKLEDINLKEGLYDLEIHTSWFSTISKDPKTKLEIPALSELKTNEYTSEKIENLEDGKNYKIKGIIIDINRNNLRYFKCPNCKERVYLINNEFICESCNEQVEPIVNMFGSINIDDGTGIIKCVMFSNVIESFFKLKKEDLKKELDEDQKSEIFSYLDDELLSKNVIVCGRAKHNDFSSKLEFIVNSINLE